MFASDRPASYNPDNYHELNDGMVSPQIGKEEIFEPHLPFAVRYAKHIKFCLAHPEIDAEDPNHFVIY